MIKRIRLQISGKVQGVWYRASTQQKAQELGLTGWVRNEPDGSVLAEAEGTANQLADFAAWCHQGPTHARVSGVAKTDISPVGSTSFEIIR
jgi:acylphosphatase